MRTIKTLIISLSVLLFPLVPLAIVSPASALTPGAVQFASQADSAACSGIDQLGDSTQNCGSGQSNINKLVSNIVSLLSLAVGIIATIMIIVAGFKYITAGGDSNNVSSAKNTLIYALIGVAIAALAQFFVHFALGTAQNAVTPSTSSSTTRRT